MLSQNLVSKILLTKNLGGAKAVERGQLVLPNWETEEKNMYMFISHRFHGEHLKDTQFSHLRTE